MEAGGRGLIEMAGPGMKLRMGATASLLALGLLVLSGCGDSSSGNGLQLSQTTTAPRIIILRQGRGPYGKLGFDHVGPVKKGMSPDQVRKLFGNPARIFPGEATHECPISEQWRYQHPPRGNKLISSVWLDFGPPNDTFVAYHAEGGHYRTDFGVGMGSTEAALRQAVGNRLTSKLGQPPLSVRRGPDQLWFLLEAGRLWEIAGGHFRKCF